MHRGLSSNDLNSIQDTSESGETIMWTNVGEEAYNFFGFLISIFLISVHILYVVDVTVCIFIIIGQDMHNNYFRSMHAYPFVYENTYILLFTAHSGHAK